MYSKIEEDMTNIQNEFTSFERRIDHVLNIEMGNNRLNNIHSISNKYNIQTQSKKRTTVLEEYMKKVKKTLGSLNILMGGDGGLISQIKYIQGT